MPRDWLHERGGVSRTRRTTRTTTTANSVIQPAHIREVAVIGLGLMGSGIAELLARSGRRIVAIEINQTFLDLGMARCAPRRTRRPAGASSPIPNGVTAALQARPERDHLPGPARIPR